ncbi:Zinc finger, C3HC4 type (RING finger) containing protein, putative [Leishmania lindenbergi]|uniref:Zinc finger, C3HC4 type (RING finger) containing protein n=1 Tax=Leishmania lindenbergi TaxID=651832 RepID=A0AAW3AHC9_9TRYP
MEFDALLNTFCLSCVVLLGLWVIAHVVQAAELRLMLVAYTQHRKYVFVIPFVPLLTRLFHEMAVPQFVASDAIQRGELPPATMTRGHHTRAEGPMEYVGTDGAPSVPTLTGAHSVTSAPLSPPSTSMPNANLRQSPLHTLANGTRGRASKASKEKKRKWAGDVADRENVPYQQEQQQQQGSVAAVIVDSTRSAVDGSDLTSSPDPAWWTPQLEGRCLVLGLHLPLELLPAASRGSGISSDTGNGHGNGSSVTKRQPTVSLQLKKYQLLPASPILAEAAPSRALRPHRLLSSSAGLQTQVAIARQLMAARVHVCSRAALSHMRMNTSVVPSPRQRYSSPAASWPNHGTWPAGSWLTRASLEHLDFDDVKCAYTRYYQRLLEMAVAEQAAISHGAQSDRKSTKRAQRISAMLMRYLDFAHMSDAEGGVKDGDVEGGAEGNRGGGTRLGTNQDTSRKRRPAEDPRTTGGSGNSASGPLSHKKRRGRTRSGKSHRSVGAGTAGLPQCSHTPRMPMLGASVYYHSDEYDTGWRSGDLSSAVSGHSHLYHTVSPLPPSQSILHLPRVPQTHSSASLMQSPLISMVPPLLPPVHESRHGSSKRHQRAGETSGIADGAVEVLEGLVERVRLAQTLRPRYRSLLCTVRFAAERFVVRRGASEPPTWTPLQTVAVSRVDAANITHGAASSSVADGRGVVRQDSARSTSLSSSLPSPHQARLRQQHGGGDSDSANLVCSPVVTRGASASDLGAQSSENMFGLPGDPGNQRGNSDSVASGTLAALSSQISSSLADSQLPTDTRLLSPLPSRPSSATVTPVGIRIEHGNNGASLHSHPSDPPPPALPLPPLETHSSAFASAQLLLPELSITTPPDSSAEHVVPLDIPSASAGNSGSASAVNAAIEFLRTSRLQENNKRAALAAGTGNSAVVPSSSSTLQQNTTSRLISSSTYSTTAELAATRAPHEDGLPHWNAIKRDFSMSAGGALRRSWAVSTSSDEEQQVTAAAGAAQKPMPSAAVPKNTSRVKSAASSRPQQQHPQRVPSSIEEAPQSAAAAATQSPWRIAASASPPSLQPRSTDLRVVYVIGADRATLLRSLTLDATRCFAAGTQNFLCFFTRRDEQCARRRHIELLDQQNGAELPRGTRRRTLAGASRPFGQHDRSNDDIHSTHPSSAVPLHNRAEEKSSSASAAATLRSVKESPWQDMSSSSGGLPICALEEMHDGVFGDAGTANQQPRATMLSAASHVNTVATTVTMPSAHQRDDPFFSSLQSLESSLHSVRELPAASTLRDSRSSNAPVVLTSPNTATAVATSDGEIVAQTQPSPSLSPDSRKPVETTSTSDGSLFSLPSLDGARDSRGDTGHAERRWSVSEKDWKAPLQSQGATGTTTPLPPSAYTDISTTYSHPPTKAVAKVAKLLPREAIIATNLQTGNRGTLDYGVTAAATTTTTNTVADAAVQPGRLASHSEEPAAADHKRVGVAATAAAVAGPVLDVTPPTASTAALPLPAASSPTKASGKTKKGASVAVDNAVARAAGATASEATVNVTHAPLSPLPRPAHPVAIDSVPAHDVRQYLAAVGVTLPEQAYLLRDAGALTPLQQLQHRLAAPVHTTGTAATGAAVPPSFGGTAAHRRALLSASADAVLNRGATRILEGQVEVAELSLDVLSRQISPYVPLQPPMLSDSDDADGAESSMGDSSSGASSDSDGKVGAREAAADARHSSPSSQRGTQPQKPKSTAAVNYQLGRSSTSDGPAKHSGKASLPRHAHSRHWHQQHPRSSRGHGQSSVRTSLEQRQRQHERRRKRHLDRWNRRIQRRRVAASKVGNIPIAVGVLFFTAPPTLPAALVQQQQRQRLLEHLHSGERGRLLVPDWALNGPEVAAPAPVSAGDVQQAGQHASPPPPHVKQSPQPNICVTLIYTATAEEVAQALVRAAEVAASLTNQSGTYDAVDASDRRSVEAASHHGRWSLAVAEASERHTHSSYDSHELLSSKGNSELYPQMPPQQRSTGTLMGGSWHSRRPLSQASTAAPSNGSFCHSCLSENVTPLLPQGSFSVMAPDVFANSGSHLHYDPVTVSPTYQCDALSPPSGSSETAPLAEAESIKSPGYGGRHDGTATPSAAAFTDADSASPLMSVRDRPPSLLLLTESSDSAYDYRECGSGNRGSATAAGGGWGGFGHGAAGSGATDDGVVRTATTVYVEKLERRSSSDAAAHLTNSENVDGDIARAGSAPASSSGVRANEAELKPLCFKATEDGRGEEDKVGVANKLMNVLRDSACFPDGVPVDVSLTYVRIGDDLYAITEVVDRTFLQYREERVMWPPTSREEGDGGDGSPTSLSDSGEDVQTDVSLSSSSVAHLSLASGPSFNTRDVALEATQGQHKAAARQQHRRSYHRRRAVSTSNFGSLSYSLAGSAPLRPGMRRQEVHMCWRCLSTEAAVIFIPCGHYAVCEMCAELLPDCCLCRMPILSSVVLLERDRPQRQQQPPSAQQQH